MHRRFSRLIKRPALPHNGLTFIRKAGQFSGTFDVNYINYGLGNYLVAGMVIRTQHACNFLCSSHPQNAP